MNSRTGRFWLVALVVWFSTSPATGRAQTDEPRLMLNTSGPAGSVGAVKFSADGKQLYAAGSGKLVNVWNLVPRDDTLQAIPADPLRWEIARGTRGRIYTLDVAPAASSQPVGKLAVGGFSARGSTGDVVIFDPRMQRIEALLPARRPDVPGPGPAPGHLQSVGAVSFSGDGRQLVSVALDGEVRLWTLGENGSSRILQPASGVDGIIRTAAFVGERRLILPLRDPQQPAAWRLSVLDPATPGEPGTIIPGPFFWYGVSAIAATSDGREFAASDLLGTVTIFSADPNSTPRPVNRPSHHVDGQAKRIVAALAYNPERLLAISTTADADGVCWLELWNTAVNAPQLVLEHPLGRGPAAAAVDFSPDGRWLAVARADRAAVELFPVRGGAAPLDLERSVELTGRGREPGRVQFVGRDGYRLAIDSPTDDQRLLFDLQTVEILRAPGEGIPVESRPVDASGWRLVPQPAAGTSQQLQLFAPQSATPRCSITLQIGAQGTYARHAWLSDEQGQMEGVAVATDRQDGIFLYDLPAAGVCRLMRYFRDHSDAIRSLSVSADGRYLASSSADQTVKIWSLAGLRGVNAQFPREEAWGATFAIENGRVVVRSALGAGIAVHRDLLTGDEIVEVAHAGPNGNVTAADPDAVLRMLSETPLWETLVLTTRRDGQPRAPIVVMPAWEPLATLFVDRSREWALWTPQGVYDSSAAGDALFGWHVNIAREADPRYFRAEQFRGDLEKPEVMRQLLLRGSLQDALIAVAAARPPAIGDIAAVIPQVRLLSPRNGEAIGRGETIAIEAAVRYVDAPAHDADDYRPQLWINQRSGGDPAEVREVDGEYIYRWSVPPIDEQNRVTLQVERIAGAVDSRYSDAWVQVAADVPPQDVALHLFAISAENYSPGMELDYCNDDARGVAQLLQTHEGRRYRPGRVRILTDEQGPDATGREHVQAEIASFKAQLAQIPASDLADDILVVFVSGHGDAYDGDYYFVPPHPDLTSDLSKNQTRAVVERIGIPWTDLQSLAEINCRKLFLLDTCYSGNVTEAEKSSSRPLRDLQVMVFSATSAGQLALGDRNPDRPGHGFFTGFVLDACAGKADGVAAYAPVPLRFVPLKDGNINLKEVVSYVGFHAGEYYQYPKYTPIELLDFVDLSLFRVLDGTDLAPRAPAE